MAHNKEEWDGNPFNHPRLGWDSFLSTPEAEAYQEDKKAYQERKKTQEEIIPLPLKPPSVDELRLAGISGWRLGFLTGWVACMLLCLILFMAWRIIFHPAY